MRNWEDFMEEEIRAVAEAILCRAEDAGFVRIFSHYDADGLTSAGILCNAFLRKGIPFHTSIVPKLSPQLLQALRAEDGLILLCDMGTAQLDAVLEQLSGKNIVIIDHHAPPPPPNEPPQLPRTLETSSFSANAANEHSSALAAFSPSVLLNKTVAIFTSQEAEGAVGAVGAGEASEVRDLVCEVPSITLLNPVAVTGKDEDAFCAASLAYLVAKHLGNNTDLAGLALAGALGDRQQLSEGVNRQILDEALNAGVVSARKGLKLSGESLREALLFSTDPYTELAGSPEMVEAFCEDVGVPAERKISELTEEEQQRIADALVALLHTPHPHEGRGEGESEKEGTRNEAGEEAGEETESVSEKALRLYEDALFGTTFILNEEVIASAEEFMRIIDACGRFGKGGIGIALCLRDESVLEDARRLHRKFQTKLVLELRRVRESRQRATTAVKEMPNLYYFFVRERGITGVLAGILARYIFVDKPVVVLNTIGKPENETKISARCGTLLKGVVDLSTAVSVAALKVGGFGGGHPSAAGASIPAGTEKAFIEEVNRIVSEQRKSH
ncbi:MAG: DHHA1 domain-containing protein [Candidatus Methanospirare jalkutatii]|nr:MAG: DHHA1 domain-containing protein [Candidatus Methanospirare jalkutatii]